MERKQFERLVHQALSNLPEKFAAYLDNVDIVVEDWPTKEMLAGRTVDNGDFLLGLYEGVPLTERRDYGMVLPDKITIFQKSIESICDGPKEIVEEVRLTVVHEVAHHFGISDRRLEELGVK